MMLHEPVQSQAIAPVHPLMTPVFPRFTPQEVMILNVIVANYPDPVRIDDVIAYLRRNLAESAWGGPTRDSVIVAMTQIRAKLGEKKNHPSRLISVYRANDGHHQGRRLLGYAWRG